MERGLPQPATSGQSKRHGEKNPAKEPRVGATCAPCVPRCIDEVNDLAILYIFLPVRKMFVAQSTGILGNISDYVG